jgi:dTDP-4-amino-4,6-dideoxygalactose transaminase
MEDKLFVTAPSLAPLKEYIDLLEGIWSRGILTHNGPLVQELESRLNCALSVQNVRLVTNGTMALQMAIKALDLKGEIITTPFTWIATLSAIQWEGCIPIFCDVEEDTFNIDGTKIEELITDKTVAIMPVHVFGNPCDVDHISAIASKYNLKVIYDAAHAVGSTFKGRSLLDFGDISATSLHATKILNTGEGGAIVSNSPDLDEIVQKIRFFGHNEAKEIKRIGTNGKMTEIHAALGLVNLRYFGDVLSDRKKKYHYYKTRLKDLDSICFQELKFGESNYSYFPIVFKNEMTLIKSMDHLEKRNIYSRRYFYPSVNTFTEVVEYCECPISENLASRILCLPLYFELDVKDIDFIIDELIQSLS